MLMFVVMLYAQRDSKLTRMLQNSLGGNAKTTLIVTASPSAFVRQFRRVVFLSKWYIYEYVLFTILQNDLETLSTLRFGQRAKMIQNRPTAHVELGVDQYKAVRL